MNNAGYGGFEFVSDAVSGAHSLFTIKNATTTAFSILNTGNVGIGTTSPQNPLDVNGIIRAKEVKVTLDGWSDYVFDKGYKLMSLNAIEDYITLNKRLPEVPSTKEVLSDGVNLGEMNTLLIKKVEELTLYVIELNRKIEKLESERNR